MIPNMLESIHPSKTDTHDRPFGEVTPFQTRTLWNRNHSSRKQSFQTVSLSAEVTVSEYADEAQFGERCPARIRQTE